jgi:hypothetical protein
VLLGENRSDEGECGVTAGQDVDDVGAPANLAEHLR